MKRDILAAAHARVSCSRYSPGERHAAHRDLHSRISVVLHGGYREENGTSTVTMRPGDVLLKSKTAKHEDQFGDHGAELLALEFIGPDDPFDAHPEHAWRHRADAFALRHAFTLAEAARAKNLHAAETAAADLLAFDVEPRRAPAPQWLNRLKDEIEQQGLGGVNVASRARAAGAHPAHASRLFRHCFGASITEHAQLHAVRRALSGLRCAASLSALALDAGFYDQSHMNRVFRRVTGRAPGAVRAMLAGC